MTIDSTIEAEYRQAIDNLRGLKFRPIKAYRALFWMHFKQEKYGNYKQGMDTGYDPLNYKDDDADIKKEGWGALTGMSRETAMERYLDLAKLVLKYYS
ncbi:acyl-CoA-binding protein [Pseudomonas sp. 210_17 TE3656]